MKLCRVPHDTARPGEIRGCASAWPMQPNGWISGTCSAHPGSDRSH